MESKDVYEPKPGEWVQPARKGYIIKCCDCGLEHLLKFRYKNRKIGFKAFRIKKSKLNKDDTITVEY